MARRMVNTDARAVALLAVLVLAAAGVTYGAKCLVTPAMVTPGPRTRCSQFKNCHECSINQCLPICVYEDNGNPCCQLWLDMGNGTMMDKPVRGSCAKCHNCTLKHFQCMCFHDACGYYDKAGCDKYDTLCQWEE